MALDRQSIEKKDFPIGRRGYEPDAVDSHLEELASEVDALRRSSRRRSDTLASTASDQVRAIVQAAETSASEIQRQAEDEARDIRDEASVEAQRTRDQATEQAREYVSRVSEAATMMVQRIDAMDGELGTLVDSLRTGANRLSADMSLLQQNMGELGAAAGAPAPRVEPPAPRPRPRPPAPVAAPPPPAFEPEPEPAFEPTFQPEPPPEPEPSIELYGTVDEQIEEIDDLDLDDSAARAEVEAPLTGAGDDDAEGARLIALNMALNGTPRDETDRYLAENFELDDRAQLLDEVYASVE